MPITRDPHPRSPTRDLEASPLTLMRNPSLAYAVKFVPCHLLPRGIAMLYESGRGQRPPHFNRLREKDRSSLHVTC